MLVTPLLIFLRSYLFLFVVIDKYSLNVRTFDVCLLVLLSLGILDIVLVEMLGYCILGIGRLRILDIVTLKTEQYSACGAH